MLKIYMNDKRLAGAKLLRNSTCGSIYRLKSGEYFKLFDLFIKRVLNSDGSLEGKIMSAKPIETVPEIIVPSCAVYTNPYQDEFVGYVTPPAEGIDFNRYDDNYTLEQRENLVEYANIFRNMIDAVRRANQQEIVFPDLCTCDNMFLKNGKISFIDYDGLQVGKHKVYAMSTTLGDERQYYVPKYFKNDLFTPELDKKSLVLLYFLSTFNVNLNKIGERNPFTKQIVTLDEVFELIGLKDYDFMEKVDRCLSPTKTGEYIDEDVVRISQEYDMKCFKVPVPGGYIKKLIKK